MSDGLDPEIAALLAQSGDSSASNEAPAESDAGFSFDSPSECIIITNDNNKKAYNGFILSTIIL